MSREALGLLRSVVVGVLLLCVAGAALAGCSSGEVAQGSASTESFAGCWGVVPSPGVDAQYVELTAIHALAPNDVWAVGSQGSPAGDLSRTLAMHWDGSVWSVVPSPNGPAPATGRNSLYQVSGSAAGNVWAVGAYTTGGSQFHALVMRWDGRQWANVYVPPIGPQGEQINAVAAIAPDNVWMAGSYITDETQDGHMFVLRYNGKGWDRSELPLNTTHIILSLAPRAPDDIWAAGTQVLHYNGKNWRILSTNEGAYFDGVTALGPDDAWVVGNDGDSAITLHWDGQKLNIVQVPGLAAKSFLHETVSLPNGDVWVAGENAERPSMRQPLLMKWTGEHWAVYPNPLPGVDARLEGLTAAGGELWAAGSQTVDGKSQPLFLRYTGGACK